MKRNWKASNGLMVKSKKCNHKEFIVNLVSTNDTSKICNSFSHYFIDRPGNIHQSIPFCSCHPFDQIHFNDRSMFFRNVMETEILESTMCLNKEGGINNITRKIFVMCENLVAYHQKELLNFCRTSGVHSNIF